MLDQSTLTQLGRIAGREHILTPRENLACYGFDAIPRPGQCPDAVVIPPSAEVPHGGR